MEVMEVMEVRGPTKTLQAHLSPRPVYFDPSLENIAKLVHPRQGVDGHINISILILAEGEGGCW